jgi:hypothetical protein
MASGIHHGGEHAHVIGRGPVHALRRGRDTAKNVATADHDGQLHAGGDHGLDLGGNARQHFAIDSVGVGTHQRLAGKLEQHAAVGGKPRRRSFNARSL